MKHRAAPAVLILAMALCVAADSTSTRLELLEQKVSSVISKAGIQFGGTFRSHFLVSDLDTAGPLVDNNSRSRESVEYTSVDFDINARPNDIIGGRLVFRMHQDWRNFFSDISNPIFSRWISIDGSYGGVLRYNAGDFRQRYSKLTLWSPDIEIPFEPLIFERQRREATQEVFLGNNDRLFQGLNLNFDAEIAPILAEFHANAMASRLRTAEVSIQNGSAVADKIETAPMDKYLLGLNLDAVIVPGLSVGGSLLRIFDTKQSFAGTKTVADTMAQATTIAGVRAKSSTKLFLHDSPFEADIHGEFAFSRDDSLFYDINGDSSLNTTTIGAAAINAGISATLKPGSAGTISASADFLRTAANFRNELTQSPSFIPDRIMNVENDIADPGRSLYTTTDALYRHVFKFTPSETYPKRLAFDYTQSDTVIIKGQDTADVEWVKMPKRKLAYTSTIFTQNELKTLVSPMLDPAVQLIMPLGPATPNRTGLTATASAHLAGQALNVAAGFSSLKQIDGDSVTLATLYPAGTVIGSDTLVTDTVLFDTPSRMPSTAYTGFNAGFSLDIAKLVSALQGPLQLSAGYSYASASNSGASDRDWRTDAGFLNAGLYWNFWKRFALLGGYQHISVAVDPMEPFGAVKTTTVTETTDRWAAGLEYKIGEAGVLTGLTGRTQWKSDISTDSEFSQWQSELHLTVTF